MSKAELQRIEHLLTWLTRATVVTLASVAVYFLQDIHSEIKTTSHTVATHETRIAVLEALNISKP